MKTSLILTALSCAVFAGSTTTVFTQTASSASSCSASGFEGVIRPVTNPTLFDSAIPQTLIRPIFAQQRISDKVATTSGNSSVGGDFQVYALQFEYALSDRFSIVANKDGYIDFNPNDTLSESHGFANLAAGFKYALKLDAEKQCALSTIVTVEAPTGNTDVFQGEGKGAINVGLAHTKLLGGFQLHNSLNVHTPFSKSDSLVANYSTHLSYEVFKGFHPFVEAHVFQVLNSGNGNTRFDKQVSGLVPSVARFEGGDLINLGSSHAQASTIVTAAAGARYELHKGGSIGAAYEIPLSTKEKNLMKDRVTVDYVLTF